MPTLQIDGVGDVDVDASFLKLTPQQQSVEVDSIIQAVKPDGGSGGLPADDWRAKEAAANLAASTPPEQSRQRAPGTFGQVLPLARDEKGELKFAIPEFLEGPLATARDIITGKRSLDQISGQEGFELGALFAGVSPAAGTGKGIAATERAAKPAPEAPPVAPEAPAAVAPGAVAPPVAVEAPPVAAAVEAAPAVTARAAEATAPADLKTAAKSYYKQADDAGVVIAPSSMKALADDVAKVVSDAGIDKTLHPRASSALGRISEAVSEPLSFNRLEILRRVANAAGKTADRDEGRIAGIIVDKIDDFIRNLGQKDVVAGDAKIVSEVIPKARELWSRVAKLEKVEGMVDRAMTSAPNFSGSGFENALRTEFRSLAKNQRQMRTFTPDEQKAIKKVARGGFKENVSRNVGKLAPSGIVSGALSGGIGATLGTAIGIGPVAGAAATTSVGFAARKLATALTKRNVTALESLIAKGGQSEMANQALIRNRALLQRLGVSGALEDKRK